MAQGLRITEITEGDEHVLVLAGRLDTNTAPDLDALSRRIHNAERTTHIVVDMGQCPFVSSAGLRVIVAMQKRTARGGSLRFCNVGPEVMEVLRSTGFDRILDIE